MKKTENENLETGLGTPPVGGTVQIGTVVAYLGTTAPENWLFCDGDNIPEQYTQLKNLIGSKTPDLCGRTLIGAGTGTDASNTSQTFTLKGIGGEYTQTLTIEQMPSHQHYGWGASSTLTTFAITGYSVEKEYTGSSGSDVGNYLFGSTFTGGVPKTGTIETRNKNVTSSVAGTTQPHDIVQPYYTVNFIIYAGTE